MNIQEMLSRMNPEILAQGLKKISANMSPEQLAQAEAAIKGMSQGGAAERLKNMDAEQLLEELRRNPQMLKQLSQNGELISKLNSIVNSKQ